VVRLIILRKTSETPEGGAQHLSDAASRRLTTGIRPRKSSRQHADMQRPAASKFAVIGTIIGMCCFSQQHAAAETATSNAPEMTTLERVNSTDKGQLKNPLSITPEIIAEGKALYQAKTCGACHGGNGSGIHCPSLVNDAWIYGEDDDTLFRLVALGSEEMLSGGYSRGDKEKHAGPMPAFGEMISNEQELWKIIAYIRSLNPAGRKSSDISADEGDVHHLKPN
jgi:mono/diheme cytochrome c family protein